ncbi:MAG: alpha-2-macroglobulin [Devosia sp.]|uniref:alpha-2-macroglobulin family protein n=1 Tax=Devosia sp. TaxID=1871048 RepID=UPI0026035EFB|nr:alpha-2-macroglobulin family protein [Devosia sp.]MDB5586594.1 alpha-2-macroglobulin [Devosia sp.]
MQRLFAFAVWLCAAFFLALALTAPAAAQKISLMKGTDLPGFDYSILKDVDLDACQSGCKDDRICRAFTFNEQTNWCFLKGDVGPETAFAKATSGRVDRSPIPAVTAAARQSELPFPAQSVIDSARSFAQSLPQSDPAPPKTTYADLLAAGDQAAEDANTAAALLAYRQALGVNDNDPAVWLKLATVALTQADAVAGQPEGDNSSDLGQLGLSAALNAFLQSQTLEERTPALAAVAHGLEYAQMWREAIATYRARLALAPDAELDAHLDKVVAEHGFRITSNEVDAEATTPRVCMVFSDPLPTSNTDLSSYITVENAPKIAVETAESQICIQGLEHGGRYNIKVRAGLPSADNESLRKDVVLNVYIPDRSPFVAFANNAYVMPAGLGGGLPITSVNAASADITIYRIGDRSIATAVRNGIFAGSLSGYSASDVANEYGEQIWTGQIDLAQGKPNELTTTAIPVSEALTDIAPGAYVVTGKVTKAAANSDEDYDDLATQWFIVTDMGLTTISGDDGVHAFVRSLSTAEPIVGSKVRLVAVNNEILGETTTDADGQAVFAPGLARGTGGRAPQLLVAETTEGDYAFLDMSKTAFDLTDRGVEGRPSPGPLDAFATTERGVYRPGETVFLTALLRDVHAKAVLDLPLTLQVERPDGVLASTELLKDSGAGGYFAALPMVADAMRGAWTLRLYADPKAEALTSTTFLVEDFEPERLAFEISAPDAPMQIGEPNPINVAAKYLYGATAPNLSVEADAVLRPVTTLKDYPGYTFGRLDDTIETSREPLGEVGVTDESGNVVADVTLPDPGVTTRPLEAQVIMRLVDTNGRTVERTLSRPVLATVNRIGVKPQFADGNGIADGSQASFDVISVGPGGETIDNTDLNWTLSRVDSTYQWYRDGSTWKWESITTTREVANGSVDTLASGPVTVGAAVNYGLYRLEIESTGENATSTSYEFYAGYYYPEAGSDTPDTLKVALDKTSYKAGDTAVLRLDPQFAGTVLVMVVDDRIIDMKAVPVPAEGASIDLPVTADWGPGAYVTAILYRPASVAEKRMPARALGLAYADVDPGDAKLTVNLDVPKVSLPRQPFTVKVSLPNATAGQKAYVAVAAVDLGILNLTNFQTPDPDGWYFGQRQLGMDVRDLYGSLIDPTQGLPGALRSGGDGAAARLGTPPPTSVLVALHSGIVEVGADGTATVSFDMPDFSGTVRVMAMAWSADAVGHSSADVIVRDPVVINMSPPRFLRLDDTSRLLVEINNISGPAGAYKVALTTGEGLSTDAAETSVDLAAGARTSLNLGLTGTAIGDQKLTLTVTDPEGKATVKDLTLGVRAASGPWTTSKLLTIEPGATVTIDGSYFAGLVDHSASMTLGIGPVARLDIPELLLALDRYPYGCSEQITSRAIPLLYLNEVAQMIQMGTDAELDQRLKDAITSLLSNQTSTGGFGLWGPLSTSDLWLDSYVTDFLLRARAAGYVVPDLAMNMALDNLGNQVSYAADFDNGGQDVAYALYDMARAGRAAIGDLRYYLEARLDAFGSPLAKAQLGAALALYGDGTRAATAFQAAVEALKEPEAKNVYRTDYGSRMRDTAAVLALASEFKPEGVDIAVLTASLAKARDLARYTSTQEDAWTLVAAAAVAQNTADSAITVDGKDLTGSVYQRFDQEHFDGGTAVTIVNNGAEATQAKVSVTGIPAVPPEASSEGFTIRREFFQPDGTAFDIGTSPVSQNDRFVVVLTMRASTTGSGQYVVADPLPAGFEIENPDLSASGVGDLSWLPALDQPSHVESRTDQFVAAFQYGTDQAPFKVAYMVRATAPGTFVLPGATVEDMYRPDLRANTAAGSIEISATGP